MHSSEGLAVKVGRRIAELRSKRGLTQEQFSERAGVGLRYIQRVEGGEENLTLESLYAFAEILSVQVSANSGAWRSPIPIHGDH